MCVIVLDHQSTCRAGFSFPLSVIRKGRRVPFRYISGESV